MSISRVANSGILGEDWLDDLRGAAILAAQDAPLPPDVAAYISHLERRLIDLKHQERGRALAQISWPETEADE